jgi:hypothetical protein
MTMPEANEPNKDAKTPPPPKNGTPPPKTDEKTLIRAF